MAKGQQKSNKEAKKPKKDGAPAKPISPDAQHHHLRGGSQQEKEVML